MISLIGRNLTASFIVSTALLILAITIHCNSFHRQIKTETFLNVIEEQLAETIVAVGFDDLSFRLITESPFAMYRESSIGSWKTYEVMIGESTNWSKDLKDLGDALGMLSASYAYTKPVRVLLVTYDAERVILIYEGGRIERL